MHASDRQQHQQTSRELQRTLYQAAKRSRTRRFHALYDRIYRPDVLWRAWVEVRANGGRSGIDDVSIKDVEMSGVQEFLKGIADDLKAKEYRPKPVRRVHIPKSDGKTRPLGIPTIRDRVVQQACKIVIEPLFEALFEEFSYGFRPKRSAHQAVEEIGYNLMVSWHVVDADIEGFFDNLDHEVLVKLVARRISDRRVLKLIRQWLGAGCVEDGQYMPTAKGTPQGGVISPLLANIYLQVLDRHWTQECGHLGKLIRYADDFVVLCRSRSQANQAMREITTILERLKLRLHPEKTKIINVRPDGFSFLGFYFRKCFNKQSGKLWPYMWPSSKAMKNVRQAIRDVTAPKWLAIPIEEVVRRINEIVRGWRNYFKIGNSSEKFRHLDNYVRKKLKRYFLRKLGKRARRARTRFRAWYDHCGVERFYTPGICVRSSANASDERCRKAV